MMLGAPVGCLIGSLLIDRIGRKRTIVPAFLFTGVFGLMYAFQTSTVSAIIVGFLLMMCLYVLMASVVAVYARNCSPPGSLPLRRLRERRGQAAQCVDADGGGLDAYLAWCHVHLCGHQRDCYCIDADCRLLARRLRRSRLGDRFPHGGITADNVHSASCVVICRAPFCCSSNCW